MTVNGRAAPYNECNPILILSTHSVYSCIAELILQTVTVFWRRNVSMGIYVTVYEYVYIRAPVFVWVCNRRSLTCQCSCFCLMKYDSQEFIQKLFSDSLPTLRLFLTQHYLLLETCCFKSHCVNPFTNCRLKTFYVHNFTLESSDTRYIEIDSCILCSPIKLSFVC